MPRTPRNALPASTRTPIRDPYRFMAKRCACSGLSAATATRSASPEMPAQGRATTTGSLFRRYAAAGAFATGAHYALLVALVEVLQAQPGPAAAFAAAIGALVGYLLNRRFTFVGAASHRHALPRFLATAAVGAVSSGLIVSGATARWGWHYLAAQALATGAVLLLTFHINRRWAFAHT